MTVLFNENCATKSLIQASSATKMSKAKKLAFVPALTITTDRAPNTTKQSPN